MVHPNHPIMNNHTLSQKAIDVLEENGYHFNVKGNSISFKYSSGIMGIFVALFITLFLSIPVFSAGIVYGIGLIILVVGLIVVKRIFFSKRAEFIIHKDLNTFTARVGTYHQENLPLTMISSILLHSQFIDEYTTAARNSIEEHLISIRIQLITKEEITIFQLKSEQSEPTEAINEIYALLENSVKGAKIKS